MLIFFYIPIHDNYTTQSKYLIEMLKMSNHNIFLEKKQKKREKFNYLHMYPPTKNAKI